MDHPCDLFVLLDRQLFLSLISLDSCTKWEPFCCHLWFWKEATKNCTRLALVLAVCWPEPRLAVCLAVHQHFLLAHRGTKVCHAVFCWWNSWQAASPASLMWFQSCCRCKLLNAGHLCGAIFHKVSDLLAAGIKAMCSRYVSGSHTHT